MGFKCGIVGLPNVGKSTLFNALTNSSKAQAANFPFCTIEPNVGVVPVPDNRLQNLAKISMQGRMLGDLKQCAEIIEEAIHNQGMDAKKAAKWLYQQRLEQSDSIPENRRSNSDTEEQAINIVTIHRSKGLKGNFGYMFHLIILHVNS